MRHHGVPTRLLDWSYSPFVALFFACEERDAALENDAAVWMVNTSLIEKKVCGLAPGLITNFVEPLDLSSADHFKALALYAFDGVDRREGLVAHFLPRLPNARMASHQGTFLINCNHRVQFQDSLRSMMGNGAEDEWIKKWVFPYSLRPQILEYLFRLNIHPLSLFPDLDGLGRLVALKGEIYPHGTFE